jgi:hypothetical protein
MESPENKTHGGVEAGATPDTIKTPDRCTIEKIYHMVNGEVRVTGEKADLIFQIISDKDPIKEFDGEPTPYGYFRYSIYAVDGIDGLLVEAIWNPSPGYGWEERKLFIIRW